MTRRCSHCSNNGHNSRTCPTRGGGGNGGVSGGVKLFGVRLTDGSIIKKSASMGNLSSAHYHSSSSAAASPNPDSPLSDHVRDPNHEPDGYLSDDPAAHVSTNRRGERKKGDCLLQNAAFLCVVYLPFLFEDFHFKCSLTFSVKFPLSFISILCYFLKCISFRQLMYNTLNSSFLVKLWPSKIWVPSFILFIWGFRKLLVIISVNKWSSLGFFFKDYNHLSYHP